MAKQTKAQRREETVKRAMDRLDAAYALTACCLTEADFIENEELITLRRVELGRAMAA